jgi:hypothetical protein
MQRGSGGKRDALRPELSSQYLLERQGGSHGISGPNEHGKGRIALTTGLDEPTPVGSHHFSDKRLVSSQRHAHG